MLNEQKIRDLYFNHVGAVQAERAAGTEQAPFAVLELRAVDHLTHAYATLGASEGPLGHELVLDAIEPFAPYGAAVEAIARVAPALGAGVVLPHRVPGTPFTALLCLPPDRGGSFPLGKAGAPPHAFRLAPLTAAEQALAETAPDRVIDLLHAALAFPADRYRACLVDLPAPPPSARTEIALDRRRARAAVLSLQADVLRAHGPHKPAPERSGRRWKSSDRLPMGAHGGLVPWVEEIIRVALDPYVRHPAPVLSPPGSEGPTISGIAGTQGPTR